MTRGVRRLGYEGSVPASDYLSLQKAFRRATLVDVAEDVLALRAVKTLPEIAKITEAVALNDEIWLSGVSSTMASASPHPKVACEEG